MRELQKIEMDLVDSLEIFIRNAENDIERHREYLERLKSNEVVTNDEYKTDLSIIHPISQYAMRVEFEAKVSNQQEWLGFSTQIV